MPGEPWGVRSIPEIDSRYPLWDQPDFVRHVDEGRFYLADAEEGERETLVTSVIDAQPEQCLRLPGPSFLPLWAALTLGGFFIFGTYHWWPLAMASAVSAVGVIWAWLWRGTSVIPEKTEKAVGLGVTVPLYASGRASVSWWAMFIFFARRSSIARSEIRRISGSSGIVVTSSSNRARFDSSSRCHPGKPRTSMRLALARHAVASSTHALRNAPSGSTW